MSIPDFIRLKTIGDEPGKQRSRAWQESSRRKRREETVAKLPAEPAPADPPAVNGDLPTAQQLSGKMRIPVAAATRYLDMGCVTVDAAGTIRVNGTVIE
jgi:hypothetical protein